MAMGRQEERQGDLMMAWDEVPRSPGHVFYDELQKLLVEAGFDMRRKPAGPVTPGRWGRGRSRRGAISACT